MKTRVIHTRIWQDTFFNSLNIKEKLLFIYLLTNSRLEMTGAYEIPLGVIATETGLTTQEVAKSLDRYGGRVGYVDGYVVIKNSKRYQDYSKGNEWQKAAYTREFEGLPDTVRDALNNQLTTSYTTSPITSYTTSISYNNNNIYNNNNKRDIDSKRESMREREEGKEREGKLFTSDDPYEMLTAARYKKLCLRPKLRPYVIEPKDVVDQMESVANWLANKSDSFLRMERKDDWERVAKFLSSRAEEGKYHKRTPFTKTAVTQDVDSMIRDKFVSAEPDALLKQV